MKPVHSHEFNSHKNKPGFGSFFPKIKKKKDHGINKKNKVSNNNIQTTVSLNFNSKYLSKVEVDSKQLVSNNKTRTKDVPQHSVEIFPNKIMQYLLSYQDFYVKSNQSKILFSSLKHKGLVNIGFNCYMNSVIQILKNITIIRMIILSLLQLVGQKHLIYHMLFHLLRLK